MNKCVYLCGPITGLSYGEARFGWREYVTHELTISRGGDGKIPGSPSGIVALSPMRAKKHLATVADRDSLSPLGDPGSVLSCARGLTTRDRFDVMRSALIFVNLLGADRASIGSMIEFGWADAFRIPILTVIEPTGNLHEHAMVAELTGWRCSTLDEGIAVARAVLTEGV